MLFGEKDGFGIEAEFVEICGTCTYGKLRFWVNGSAIGEFDNASDLAASARWGRTFLEASPRRTRVDLDDAAPSEVFRVVVWAFRSTR